MADIKIAKGSDSALTITLASLATSSTWVAGRESTAVDNTTNKYLDYELSGKITVGTSPTANTEIRIYVYSEIDETPTYPDVFDGTDSDETVTGSSQGLRDGMLQLAKTILVDSTTSDRTYPFGKISIASLFGGVVPDHFGVFVTHNTGVNLNSTGGNHFIKVKGSYETIA
jgi:hypothetical protein